MSLSHYLKQNGSTYDPVKNGVPTVASGRPVSRRARFLQMWPSIRDEILQAFREEHMPEDCIRWLEANLEYNVPGGKANRGLSVVDSVELIYKRNLSDHEYRRAAILGWCIEMMQSLFLVADDMMDHSVTRRGKPCWYRVVGSIAVNDTGVMESCIYFLLRKHFRREPYYADLMDLYLETTFKTGMGQMVDLMTGSENLPGLANFSIDRFRMTVIYKTAFYSFYLPVAVAACYCGVTQPSVYDLAQSILLPLGEYFQIQDDYLDCFAPTDVLGKIGTDIVNNKNSWLINKALEVGSPEDGQLLEANYGRNEPVREAKVKEIYQDLGIPDLYKAYEKEAHSYIVSLIKQIPEHDAAIGREVFTTFLEKIFRRTM